MKILYIMFYMIVSIGTAAVAMDNDMEQKKQDNFSSKKQEVLKELDGLHP